MSGVGFIFCKLGTLKVNKRRKESTLEKQGYSEQLSMLREMFPGKVAISINEASDVLGINRNTLYDATKRLRNPLPSQRVNRKRIVIPLAGLARWLC